MTKKVISTVKHYKIQKDGSLKFVSNEHVEVAKHHWGHIASLDIRDKADARRLAKVKDMLVKTSHSFDSIAAFCGFHNTNHLRNLFKRKFRMTLSDWRKKHPK